MADFPSMPLWTDAYIGDTQHLTNEEHGVYLRLLMFAWRTQDCSLPNDDKRLAIMVGVTGGKWAKLKPTIMEFWALDGDVWRQKKLTKERAYAEKMRAQKVAAGRASAKAKALKDNDAELTAVPTAGATAEQLPIPIPTVNEDTNVSSPQKKPARRKSRMREDAAISEGQYRAAGKRGLSSREAEAQFQKFKNDAIAKGKAFVCWDRAFVTWLDSPYFRLILSNLTPINGGQNESPRNADRLQRIVTAAAEGTSGQGWG